MSALLADIDATCASLGYNGGTSYYTGPDALQSLKHLIWILRRDNDIHDYRRYIGRGQVLQTDLLPMLIYEINENEISDVLLRLLVNLTNPAILLYREQLPKDGPGRRHYLELIEILQDYKQAFSLQPVWAALCKRLQKIMEIDWAERGEEDGLLIERTLVLVRNVLQVPATPDMERRADNDASLHDQVLWALHQAGLLDIILYIIGCEYENQYHLHALEIVCLMYREQKADSLANASLQRSIAEKQQDEQELIAARRQEKLRISKRPPPGRHSRFGGTYVLKDVKSISNNDMICHQSLERAIKMDFGMETKKKQKRSHRIVKEEMLVERRSALSVRLFLREFCIEILRSAYNNLIRQVRHLLERNSSGHDDSYLLWAIRFFMEFNRISGFQLELVSESLSNPCFHWVLTRIQHNMEMMINDKDHSQQWSKRLHNSILTYRELLYSLIALHKVNDEDAQALYKMLQNNVCYVLEYREIVLHALLNYNEAHSTKAYLRDVIDLTNIFFKMMEKFCKGNVVVEGKVKPRRKQKKSKVKKSKKMENENENIENLENIWSSIVSQITEVLSNDITLPEEEHPIPFDVTSEKSIDDQKDNCMIKIHSLLRNEKFQHAIILLRSAREVWPENDCFGSITSAPEDELIILHDIFLANLGPVTKPADEDPDNNNNGNTEEDSDEDDEEGAMERTETDFRFEDFAKRLVNPKVVRACTLVLTDWDKIATKFLKSAVTILHRIAFGCKMSAMLYQASLFRIFQRVFDTPTDNHNTELKRLGKYILRTFVTIAPKNPVIYAELLFYKNIREANDLENGYDDTHTGKKLAGAWSEEQEDELRQLFMENQRNPSTDQDVIDWILDNLIEKNRTRRSVMKKMKELGLIFKAPTKKTSAETRARLKKYWHPDEDSKLKDAYDEHRLSEDCLTELFNVFKGKRMKSAIINRMIQLGLIADKYEILHKESTESNEDENVSDEEIEKIEISDDSDRDVDHHHQNNVIKKSKKQSKTNNRKTKTMQSTDRKHQSPNLNVELIRTILNELDESLKESIDWIIESLNDAAEDISESSDDPDDGVPLVPFTQNQRDSLENASFRHLLITLGLQPPLQEMEIYWRIPITFSVNDINIRSNLLSGQPIDSDEISSNLILESDSDSENIQDKIEEERAQRKLLNKLIYNKSDDEGDDDDNISDRQSISSSSSIMRAKKFNIYDLITSANSSQAISQNTNNSDDDDNDDEESKALRKRLATLIGSDDSDDDLNLLQGQKNVSSKMNSGSNVPNSTITPISSVSLSENNAASGSKRSRNNSSDENLSDKEIGRKKRKRFQVIDDDDDDDNEI